MCLKDLRDEFIYDCECRHLAKGSLRNYKAATRFLLEYLELKQITELEDVRPRHIRDLMKEKQDAGSTSRYINDLLKVWRTWFNYLVNEGYGDCVFLTDLDIIKRALLLVSERQDSVAVGYAIGNGGWCQRSMISVVTFV